MKEYHRSVLPKVTGDSPFKVYMLWDELLLTLVNYPPPLEKELRFVIKTLEKQGWKSKTKRTPTYEFDKYLDHGVPVMVTHQGFWKRILMWLLREGYAYELIDLRTPDLLPVPQLGLMRGFRFGQKELLLSALKFNCSGCVEATTRYGKSSLILNLLRAWPEVQSVLTLPGTDLIRQSVKELRLALPDREIKQIGGGSMVKYQSEDITVCSMDSLHKLDPGPVRLLLIDEPHAAVAESRIVHIPNFHLARKYAFGATLTGRFDGRDHLLEGLVGPILASKPYPAARAEGAVSLIKALIIRWPINDLPGDRARAYKDQIFMNEKFGRCIRYLSDVVIPKEFQTLFFIKTEDQCDFLHEFIGRDVGLAMAKKLTSKKREEMSNLVRTKGITRVLCSDIYVQGVTFHELMVLVNCSGGGASTTTVQKPGRLAELREGKSCGLLIDFRIVLKSNGPAESPALHEGTGCLIRESWARMEDYRKTGYEVHEVEIKEIENWFLAQNITPPTALHHGSR